MSWKSKEFPGERLTCASYSRVGAGGKLLHRNLKLSRLDSGKRKRGYAESCGVVAKGSHKSWGGIGHLGAETFARKGIESVNTGLRKWYCNFEQEKWPILVANSGCEQ